MPRFKGTIVMPDGKIIGRKQAARRMNTTEAIIIGAIRKVGNNYADIKAHLFPFPSGRVAELDPKVVYKLARYSQGQKNHREILMQLLGLDASDEDEFNERFPDA